MGLEDRILWMAVGCFVGFVLGYIVRARRDIKEIKRMVEHVDEVVTENPSKWERDEHGFMRFPVVSDVAILIVVVLTVWAAFSTAKVNGELNDTLSCITKYNTDQGDTLESRDSKIKAGTQSEIELWTKYGRLYQEAKTNPERIPALQETLNKAIMAHREDLIHLQEARESYPYPNPDIVENCKEN